jgi:peptidyl-dipeptidase A
MKNNKLHYTAVLVIAIAASSLLWSCGGQKSTDMTEDFKTFLQTLEEKFIPLYQQSAESQWNAAISGQEADYEKAAGFQFELSKIFTDKADFETLKKIKESNTVTEPLLKRQLDIIYNAYAGQQIDTARLKEMIDLQTSIEMKFNTFRANVGGKTLTDNQIEDALTNSTDTKYLEDVWTASKKSGANVAEDVIALVKLRNEVAVELGYKNYHDMSLTLSEQDPAEIEKLFDELDALTRDEFARLKGEVDEFYMKRYKIKKEELMPWHYQNRFFQEAPKIYPADLDALYKDQNIENITMKYFTGIGMDIEGLLANSDLYEKPGKNQHAFCIDIDRSGDVRVLCNIVDNSKWMNTMLHEYGHAVYSKYADPSLPFFLRDAAHTFTTEAIAQFFGRLASNPEWMKIYIGLDPAEAEKIADNCFNTLKLEQLTFSRWAQVMYRFEKSMYEDPDQNLNTLWWDLVEKYQMLKRPSDRNAPDWASKIHIATAPCYYHNYLLGELLASQFSFHIAKELFQTEDIRSLNWSNNPEIGKYFIKHVYEPGARYEWNDMIEKATGEKLTPKYYAKQFCG